MQAHNLISGRLKQINLVFNADSKKESRWTFLEGLNWKLYISWSVDPCPPVDQVSTFYHFQISRHTTYSTVFQNCFIMQYQNILKNITDINESYLHLVNNFLVCKKTEGVIVFPEDHIKNETVFNLIRKCFKRYELSLWFHKKFKQCPPSFPPEKHADIINRFFYFLELLRFEVFHS